MLFVTHHRLTFSASGAEQDELYRGSAWRGAFGHALKALNEPAYQYLFETPIAQYGADLSVLHGSHAPHPMVISPAGNEPGGEGITLTHIDLILIGRGILFSEFALQALINAGAEGIYGDRYRLQKVQHFHPACPWQSEGPAEAFSVLDMPECPDQVRLRFLHPLRLKTQQTAHHLEQFPWADLWKTLVRRYRQLEACHDSPWAGPDYAELFAALDDISVTDTALQWFDWSRYSSRQHTKVPMGGVVGELTLSGPLLPSLWPCLWLGQWLHLGKGAVMGMGRYQCLDEVAPF